MNLLRLLRMIQMKPSRRLLRAAGAAISTDRDHLVRLVRPVAICRLQKSVYGHAVPDWHGRLLDIADHVVTILPPEPGTETCDGASFCPDRIDALDLDLAPSYLTHDAGTEEMDAIAKDPAWIEAGWTQPELRRLWDDILGMMVRRQAEALKGWKRLAGNGLARVMRSAVRALGGIMHGHLSALAAAALLSLGGGCAVPPDGTVVEDWIWKPGDTIEYTVIPKDAGAGSPQGIDPDPATGEGEGGVEGLPKAEEPEAVAGSTPAPRLEFRFGGFDGSRAKEDPRCVLALGSITKDRITYRWAKGIPSDWSRGKTSKGMMVVACAFYRDAASGTWIGGKMDWTDEARTVRECTHIHDGYNGWKSEGWDSAKHRAFCVVSADGKYRSNLIED